ncbi:MAG: hypothetical protein HC818_04395 [Synechococcaceae cyanobacterium RM1_1_27]|nr:hypothetical protein [Synechococcaceae cyanobacterium RM1_1_27]
MVTGVSESEMKEAAQGTVQDGNLVYELEGKVYQISIKTIRGDYRTEQKETKNQLRQWEIHDFKPRPEDIFQERLYCIQWITQETLKKSRQETYFASVTAADLERERQVEQIVQENLAIWQEKGLVPDMAIEPGSKTDEPIRTRGWRYWHQLFNARQTHYLSILKNRLAGDPYLRIADCKILDKAAKLCRLRTRSKTDNRDIKIEAVFYNQALNTFF